LANIAQAVSATRLAMIDGKALLYSEGRARHARGRSSRRRAYVAESWYERHSEEPAVQVRNIIFAAASAGVILALVLLFVRVSESPPVEVSEQSVDRARRQHERRNQASRMRPAPVESTAPSKRPDIDRKEAAAARSASPYSDTPEIPEDSKVPYVHEFGGRPNRQFLNALSRKRADEDGQQVDVDTRLQEANELYDRRDYEGALAMAKEVLQESPGNVRMLRVAVSSSCMMGDEQNARTYGAQLPERHRLQMQRRCERYGIDLGSSE
jgi:hypothetical protein